MARIDAAQYVERPLSGLRDLCVELATSCENLLKNMPNARFIMPAGMTEKIGFFQALCDSTGFDFKLPQLTGDAQADASSFLDHFNKLKVIFTEQATATEIKDAREKYLVELGHAFRYEFSDGDLSQIQSRLNELRDRISTSDFFNEKHKERLLKKLEELQAALHKKMSDLDKFYALVGEGAVIVGRYGQAAKPFLDTITAILKLVWIAQGRAEELPSNAPNILIKSDDQEIV